MTASMSASPEPNHALSGAVAVDRRTTAARRLRDIYSGIIGQLGVAPVPADIEQRARRVASLGVWIEQQEALIAQNKPVDMPALTTAMNAQRRLLADLGLSQRRRGRNA